MTRHRVIGGTAAVLGLFEGFGLGPDSAAFGQGAGQGPDDARRIDCGGRAVIPGLIDAHWHSTLVGVTQMQAMTADIGFVQLMTGRHARATLMRGFTTVRDTGGPAFGLKLAIDRGVVAVPRILASGAIIS